jgi:hypothetical protein
MFQTDLLSIIRSLNTVFAAIGTCHASYVDCLLVRSGRNSVETPDDVQYIEFFIKNKFEK